MIGKLVRGKAVAVLVSCLGASTCEIGRAPAPHVIAGPTVPSTVRLSSPYVWDTREELNTWLNNNVSRGVLSLDGEGQAGVIRIQVVGPSSIPGSEWVLRGPDFEPPLTNIQTVRIRYKWTPAFGGAPTIPVTGGTVIAYFEVPDFRLGPEQAYASADIARGEFEVDLKPWNYRGSLDVRYAYLSSTGGNRGVLEIDAITLVQ